MVERIDPLHQLAVVHLLGVEYDHDACRDVVAGGDATHEVKQRGSLRRPARVEVREGDQRHRHPEPADAETLQPHDPGDLRERHVHLEPRHLEAGKGVHAEADQEQQPRVPRAGEKDHDQHRRMVPAPRAAISMPTVNSGRFRSCCSMAGTRTMGVTNSMPNTADMPIPKAKLRSSSRRGSMKGRSFVRLCARKIQPKRTASSASTTISVEPNHSARSPDQA